MPAEISYLLETPDNDALVRDKIGEILTVELANQRALAIADGRSPAPWDVRVYLERAGRVEECLNDLDDLKPILHVSLDNENFDGMASNVMERQKGTVYVNVDVIGFGKSKGRTGGHDAGDHKAALECARVKGLARQILMASHYTYLRLQGTVAKRWLQSVTYFQPSIGQQPILNTRGARLVFAIDFLELSPQYVPQPLETLALDVYRAEDGELLLATQYDYEASP